MDIETFNRLNERLGEFESDVKESLIRGKLNIEQCESLAAHCYRVYSRALTEAYRQKWATRKGNGGGNGQ